MENTKVLFVRNLGIKEEEKLLSVVLHIQKSTWAALGSKE